MLRIAIGGLLLAAAIAEAASLGFEAGAATAPAGTQIDVPLRAVFAAGDGVLALEAELSFPTDWTVLGVDPSAGFAPDWFEDLAVQLDGNRISFSAAGLAPLAGDGTLLAVTVEVDGSGWMRVDEAVANEGQPDLETADGWFTHTLPPVLLVQPTAAVELLPGETLTYSAVGAVDPPVAWSVADPLVGSVDAAGLYTAIAPGLDRVSGVDSAGRSGQGGEIAVRPFEVRAGEAAGTAGFDLLLPVWLANPGGEGFSAVEFLVDLESARLSCTLFETDGALCDGWDVWLQRQADGRVRVAASSPDGAPSTGEGELLRLVVNTQSGSALSVTPDIDEARLDESEAVRLASGSLTLSSTGSFQLSPNTAQLKRGQTRQLQVVGTPNGELAWSTLDGAVATVDAGGLLTALAGGATRVVAVDPLGVSDTTDLFSVHDVDLAPLASTLPAGQLGRAALRCDSLAGFEVLGWEIEAVYDTTWLEFAGVETDSTLSEAWSEVEWFDDGGRIHAAGAGAALPQEGTTLLRLLFLTAADAPLGSSSQLTVTAAWMNEGRPVLRGGAAALTYGDPEVAVDAAEPRPAFALGAAWPNPFNPACTLPFVLDRPGETRLAVYNVLGEEVRVLASGALPAGEHRRVWDGRDDGGRALAAGVYFARLEVAGAARTGRLTLLK